MVTVPKKKQGSQDPSPTPSPSPSPSPSPPPSPTPSPSPSPSSPLKFTTSYQWEELNRAREIFMFFSDVIVPTLKRQNVDPKLIAYFSALITEKAISMIFDKAYLEAPKGLSLESAISIIDEELPKLLQKSGSSEDDIKKFKELWDIVKNIAKNTGMLRGGG